MKRGDMIIAYITVFATAVSLIFFAYRYFGEQQNGLAAQITQNSKVLYVLPLSENEREVRIGGYKDFNVIRTKDGGVSVISSDCPGHDCIKAGAVSVYGSTLICLPHRLLIKIICEGDENKGKYREIDDVSW
ncbi:MAG: NusG domain II-containing protein [Synergistes sp.]|nr:NusG domain II-containing protein [Synergistes sp.]